MNNFQPPNPAQIEQVLRRIPTPSLRRAFFERLKNPLWVEPLARAGMFGNPPEPERTTDGLVRNHYWPEIGYLTRVAPLAPKAVVDVLLELVQSKNASVHGAVFRIGATIDADEAVRLVPLLKTWGINGMGWGIDPIDMVAFAVNLLRGGQVKAGKWMANLLFRPTASQSRRQVDLVLDDYWYEAGLPQVVEALGDDGLRTVLPWLEDYERHVGRLADDLDFTDISRESIRNQDDSLPSVEQALINAVRSLAVSAMLTDSDTAIATLKKSPMVLTRKITLYAMTEALRSGNADDVTPADRLLTVAEELIADHSYMDDSCRLEFCELARELASRTPSALAPLVAFIEAGPQLDRAELSERLRIFEEVTPEQVEARIQEIIDTWKHRWLSGIGSEALPPTLKTILAELDSQRGKIESPLSPLNTVTSWSGPNSPITQDEMSVMSPEELTSHLENWHAAGSRWGPEPSHEGQGRELSALIATNPRILDGVGGLASRLRPTYLRAILQGWEAAVKADLELDWSATAELIRDVLVHSYASPFAQEGDDFDDDRDLRLAKKAAVNLLKELVKKREIPPIPAAWNQIFASLLISDANDEAAWNDYDSNDRDHGMDPLTLSMNWQWPIRVHGLLNLISHGRETSWYQSALHAFEREIERPDRQGASRAVIGQGLGSLLLSAPEWLKPRVSDLFGSVNTPSRNQQVALTTAMAIHGYHKDLFDLLTPSMLAAIQSPEPLVAGWKSNADPMQRIGEWVISAIIRGHKTIGDPVAEAFFTVAQPQVRGAALGRIAWSFMHSPSVAEEIRDRLGDLWDTRVEHIRSKPDDNKELSGFPWFVKSGNFDASWWLPRLKEAADLDPELTGVHFMIGEQLAASADEDARGAFEATKALLTNRKEADPIIWDLTRNAVPTVISRALHSGDKKLQRDAIKFMNELGETGYVGLEKAVSEVPHRNEIQKD